MIELPDLTAEQEMELCRRIADRGDLQLLGLPVATIGEVYKIVQEWRIKGYHQDAVERLMRDIKTRRLLEEFVKATENLRVYEELPVRISDLVRIAAEASEFLDEGSDS